ncbi:MAG: KamA family radical SAM protein [Desulfatibacillaceae bacterium]|nr:KamA family radical SAM protein [Desulfatibacillaceae bacterium]
MIPIDLAKQTYFSGSAFFSGLAAQLPDSGRGLDPVELQRVAEIYPAKITSGFLDLIKEIDDPVYRQFVPSVEELAECGEADPLAEQACSPVGAILHRYPDRVVLLASNCCPVRCRFCLRKRLWAKEGQGAPANLEPALGYIKNTPAIREVILSGGDPLMMDDQSLKDLLAQLAAISHVKALRIHTRVPAAMPERISQNLLEILARHRPLFVNIHVNHPLELLPQAAKAIGLMADAGLVLGSQSVLLKGVNDNAKTLEALFADLYALRVRPYYLHHLDRVKGVAHFVVPIQRGLEMMDGLRQRIGGMSLPAYVLDLPGGWGKVRLDSHSVKYLGRGRWQARDFAGSTRIYTE